MRKVVLLLIVAAVLVLGGCVTYVTPGRYVETTPHTEDYEILGFFTVDLPVVQDMKEAKGVKEYALEMARESYPDADDIIDVTILSKSKTLWILYLPIMSWEVTLEGNVIQYNN